MEALWHDLTITASESLFVYFFLVGKVLEGSKHSLKG